MRNYKLSQYILIKYIPQSAICENLTLEVMCWVDKNGKIDLN